MAEWDNAHFLTKGADLSPTFGAYATLIEQAIEQAVPASTWYGPVIVSEDTPPVIAPYEWHKRAIWIKLSTKRAYFYDNDAGSWDNLEKTLSLTTLITDGSITLAKLSTSGTAAYYVLRRNSTNTAYEWVAPTSLFNAGDIAWTKMAALTNGHVPYYNGGVWTSIHLDNEIALQISDQILPAGHLYDVDNQAVANQVLYFTAAGSVVSFGYVHNLLSANSVARNKLQWDTQTVLSVSNAFTIDGNTSGCWYHELTENTTVTVTAHEGQTVTLTIKQNASAAKTVAYSGVKWAGGTAPTMSAGLSKVDVMTFIKVNGVVYGSYVQDLR